VCACVCVCLCVCVCDREREKERAVFARSPLLCVNMCGVCMSVVCGVHVYVYMYMYAIVDVYVCLCVREWTTYLDEYTITHTTQN